MKELYKKFTDLKIRTKIISSVTIIVVLISTITYFYFLGQQEEQVNRAFKEKSENLAEAVSLGIAIAVKLSHKINRIDDSVVDRSISLLKQAGLPVELPDDFDHVALASAMRGDKKSQGGKIRLVLLTALGEAQLGNPMKFDDLLLLLNESGIE